ncbi:MAG TPA: VWA domain-containing protein [Spirochaetes bacterium]|nr:VWA domain-containing protein [Spirochaetota bacterium]
MSFGNYSSMLYILLPGAFVLVLYAAYLFHSKAVIRKISPPGGPAAPLARGSAMVSRLKNALVVLSVALFSFVLLRPQWGELVREERNEGTDLLVAMDVSYSMIARDAGASRLEKAKDAVRLTVGSMKGGRAGLILFSGEAFLQCPLTADVGAFMMFLDAAGTDSIRLKGTSISSALEAAQRVYTRRRMNSRVLVLITDGEDHEGAVMAAARKLSKLDVRVYTLGVGSVSGAELPVPGDGADTGEYYRDTAGKIITSCKNQALLEKIARETGGRYGDITAGLGDVYRVIEALGAGEKNIYGSRIVRERKERYQLFGLVLALLLMLEMALPAGIARASGWKRRGP